MTETEMTFKGLMRADLQRAQVNGSISLTLSEMEAVTNIAVGVLDGMGLLSVTTAERRRNQEQSA